MGSPISPIFAELFLQKLESAVIINNPFIKFWKRYVDDVFSIIKSRKLKNILDSLNGFHPAIQFTYEEEENSQLSFLDTMTYTKNDNSIGHFVFRKPTCTNKYLNFDSFHPNAHKISVIDSLVSRGLRLSDELHIEEELQFVTSVLIKNGYPHKMISASIRKIKKRIVDQATIKLNIGTTSQPILPAIEPNVPRTILPWGGNMTKRVARKLRQRLGVEIGYIPGHKVSTMLCNTKDKLKFEDSGVYQIKCKGCNKSYIGETGRDMKIRVKEHIADVRHNRMDTSAIASHNIKTGHAIDFDSANIINKEPRYFPRKFKEGLLIRALPLNMNLDEGMNISPIWSSSLIPLLGNH